MKSNAKTANKNSKQKHFNKISRRRFNLGNRHYRTLAAEPLDRSRFNKREFRVGTIL